MKQFKKDTTRLGLASLGMAGTSVALGSVGGLPNVKGQEALGRTSQVLPAAGTIIGTAVMGRTIKMLRRP
jgi:hypothetical protein